MPEQKTYVTRQPPSSIEVDLSKLPKKNPKTITIDPTKVIKLNSGEK